MPLAEPDTTTASRIRDVVRRYWGFDELRPLQAEAIHASLAHRDSLVVMPTGGGKSLCYQVPPVVAGRLDVVVSPLIALMNDQVQGLRACGYPAAALHSNLGDDERRAVHEGLEAGAFRLLLVSPERLATPTFVSLLQRLDVRAFAIDEAHCISHWGHDFRPEYRRLGELPRRFPRASVHAFTATATPRVRQDIAEQLGLRDPEVLVGRFDRPNLIYRVVPRVDLGAQVLEIVRRHADEAVIVYCITRNDTETLAGLLRASGVNAAPYHAGLDPEERARTQNAFAREQLDVVTATVAFGMGIDRSDVRCVVHAAMPKSIEHYQQETGRAGRDGLEAECVLLHSPADAMRWRDLIERGAAEVDRPEAATAAALEVLGHMQSMCRRLECRHRALSTYFGQPYEADDCGACDVCLGEVEAMEGSTEIAQKVISCVARMIRASGVPFGVGHTVKVLRGADTQAVRSRGHHALTTWGILRRLPEPALTNLVHQLVDQGLLDRTPGERPVLGLNEASWAVLRGEREVDLVEPATGAVRRAAVEEAAWADVDHELFDALRELRREIARERGVPAYVVFADTTLRDLAAVRPSDDAGLRRIRGIGERKAAEFGPRFLAVVDEHAAARGLERDRF